MAQKELSLNQSIDAKEVIQLYSVLYQPRKTYMEKRKFVARKGDIRPRKKSNSGGAWLNVEEGS